MGSIYLVAASNGMVKVGHSQLPFERFTSLANGSPLPLTLDPVEGRPYRRGAPKKIVPTLVEAARDGKDRAKTCQAQIDT